MTRLITTPFPDTAQEEVNFWRSLEEAIRKIELQLAGPDVQITLAVLKHGRRIYPVVALERDTGMELATKTIEDVLAFLRDLPVNSLLSASALDQINNAVTAMFVHMMKLKNCKYYDLERAGKLLESLSRTMSTQATAVLSQRLPMNIKYEDFVVIKKETDALFASWKAGLGKFQDLYVDLWKKRVRSQPGSSSSNPLKMVNANFEHMKLQLRLDEIATFRAQHQKFCSVLETVLSDEDQEALRDVDNAYARFLSIDVLDISNDGKQAWGMAREAYDQRIDRLEDRIVRILNDKLSTTQSAEEMFRVFSKFNPLFFRPRIRSAISQFQMDLIKYVRDAVHMLEKKFKQRYEASDAKVMAVLRDIPPVAGKILWARQIERQLQLLMQRMEDVLGKGWEVHVQGKELKSTCDELLRKLDTNSFFR